jgi:ABC-type branched-subunit amino acid transport system substrate-binding protein
MVAGMTFFLWSCQLRAPVKEVPEDNFTIGETYRQQGELDRALDAYRAYLEQKPSGDKAALAYHRVAQTYLEMDQAERALQTLRKIQQEFPEYEGIAGVRLDIARTSYQMGQLEACRTDVLQWMQNYPDHPLRGEALELAGDAANGLGRPAEAFRWWLEAKKQWTGNLEREWELNQKLVGVLSESPPDVLEALAPYTEGTEYAPELYYTMAHRYLEQNDLEGARAAAMALVRSTPEQYWVSLGRNLLEQIRDELSVRIGALGCLLPLSGPFAIYGEEVLNGVELGMGLFSGTNSTPIDELIIRDTKDTPEDAVAALEQIVGKEKVIAVMGPLSSKTALPVAQRAQELGVPLITLTQRSGVTQVGDMVFRNFITPSREVERLVSAAVGDMGIKRFAILYPENSYGRFLTDLFWDALKTMGGRVTAIESYSPEETDFAEEIQKMTGLYYKRPAQLIRKMENILTWEEEESIIRARDPQPIVDFDAVFIPDNFRRVAMIAPQLVYHDVLDVQLLGTSLWQGAELVDLTGEYVQGAVFSSGFFEGSQVDGVDDFVREYRANFGSDPGVLAATGYDTIRLLRHILSSGSIRTRRDLRERLVVGEGIQGITGSIYFDDQGEVQKNPVLLTVSGNRITPYQ